MAKADAKRMAVRKKMERNRDESRRVDQALLDVRAKRAAIYAEGRALDPPMTYKEIAEIYGITEAAVMQLVKKQLAATA